MFFDLNPRPLLYTRQEGTWAGYGPSFFLERHSETRNARTIYAKIPKNPIGSTLRFALRTPVTAPLQKFAKNAHFTLLCTPISPLISLQFPIHKNQAHPPPLLYNFYLGLFMLQTLPLHFSLVNAKLSQEKHTFVLINPTSPCLILTKNGFSWVIYRDKQFFFYTLFC